MRTVPDEIVGSAYTDARAWPVLEELVEIGPRLAGSDGEAAAAGLLADRFDDVGLSDSAVTEFEIPGWQRGPASLSARGRTFDAEHELVALPGAPAATVEGSLVDLGYGLPPDFEAMDVEGKLVLATASAGDPPGYHRPLHRTEKYARAAEAGAAGFLFWSGLEGCLPPTGWVSLERPGDLPGPIPAAGVSHELGSRLVRYADAGATATLSIEPESAPATSTTVEATVGPPTDEEVLVTAHVDAHDLADGARDNGTGCALLVEIGRLLASLDLDTRVRLVAFGSEEVGFLGAHEWADTHDLADVKCLLNLDAIAGSRDLHVQTHGFPAIGDAFEAVGDEFDVPVAIDDAIGVFADQWAFVARGVPGANVRSLPTDSDRRWGLGRLWSHTHGDTLDKLDSRDLRDTAVLVTAGVVALASDEFAPTPVSPATIADRVPTETAEALRGMGRWPFE